MLCLIADGAKTKARSDFIKLACKPIKANQRYLIQLSFFLVFNFFHIVILKIAIE